MIDFMETFAEKLIKASHKKCNCKCLERENLGKLKTNGLRLGTMVHSIVKVF